MSNIDINCDMGEGAGNDERIMPFISSANIACGYHAGDEKSIWKCIELALQYKVTIGAHVSFLDKENFGRKEMSLPTAMVYELVTQQLVIMFELAIGLDTHIHHVKPHGALYNMAAKDPALASAVATAVKDFDPTLLFYGLSGSSLVEEGKKLGLRTVSEVFADRSYQDDGTLTPRSLPRAMIESDDDSLKQVLQMVRERTVTTLSGKQLPIIAETICVHGDGKDPVAFSKKINEGLKLNGFTIAPPAK